MPSSRRKSKSMVRIGPLKKGDLHKYGYHDVRAMSTAQRQKALARAAHSNNYASVIRKLNALYVLNRNTKPDVAQIFHRDQKWLSSQYQMKKSKSMAHKSKSKSRSRSKWHKVKPKSKSRKMRKSMKSKKSRK